MQKWITTLMATLLLTLSGLAIAAHKAAPLDSIYFRAAIEEWVKTKTARVVIAVNATASRQGLSKIRGRMMKNLNSIAKADWHFTNFSRSRDQSGLEKIYATAEARLAEHVLGGLYTHAEHASKPGSKYRISSIQFRPSLGEVEAVREQVRVKMYERIAAEVKRVRAAYPKQNFHVHKINFIPGMGRQMVRHMKMAGRGMADMSLESSAAPAAISVSQKVTLNATVVIANQMPEVKPH